MKKRIVNYGRDEVVRQSPEEADPARVRPHDLRVVNGGAFHKREGDLPGYSRFTGRGLDVNDRPMKGEQRGSSGSTARPLPPRGPVNLAEGPEVLEPSRHVVGKAASQPAFRGRPQANSGELVSQSPNQARPSDARPEDFDVDHIVPGHGQS